MLRTSRLRIMLLDSTKLSLSRPESIEICDIVQRWIEEEALEQMLEPTNE